jgi:hypothetical protein
VTEYFEPWRDAGKLRAALMALGFPADDGEFKDASAAMLLGALLALVEIGTKETAAPDRTRLPEIDHGYMEVILEAEPDPHGAAARWMGLLVDRLNRTGVELHEATEGARQVVDIAGPMLLSAANLLNLVNTEISQDLAKNALDIADGNLKRARANVGEMRRDLRRMGFQV